MSVSSCYFSYLNFTLTTLDNIYHSQMFRQTVMNSYGYMFTQRRDGKISIQFQTLPVSIPVSNSYGYRYGFSCRYRVNATPKRKISCERGLGYLPEEFSVQASRFLWIICAIR